MDKKKLYKASHRLSLVSEISTSFFVIIFGLPRILGFVFKKILVTQTA